MKPNGSINIDGLRPPNLVDMRAMRTGETRIFRIGRDGSLTLAASVAAKVGGSFTQRVVILTDPKTATSQRVFAVTCLQPAVPAKCGISERKNT